MAPEADHDRIKERIRKLLNLAQDDSAMGNEVENALRFARKLMTDHNIRPEDLEGTGRTASRTAEDIREAVSKTTFGKIARPTMNTSLSRWEQWMIDAITELVGTVSWYRSHDTAVRRDPTTGVVVMRRKNEAARVGVFVLYGPAEDCADVAAMVDEWAVTILTLARLKWGDPFDPRNGEGRAYAEGFAESLVTKVRRMIGQEKALPASTGCALQLFNANALMTAKRDAGRTWLKQVAGVTLKAGSARAASNSYQHGDALREGREDGARASLSHSRKPKLGGGA